jgi:heme-degrading monooxygenase HmoA
MYARVTTLQYQPDKLEEGVQQQQGFNSFVALQDPITGKAMLITLFETEADAKAGISSGFVQQQATRIAPFLVEAPTVAIYEVASQD